MNYWVSDHARNVLRRLSLSQLPVTNSLPGGAAAGSYDSWAMHQASVQFDSYRYEERIESPVVVVPFSPGDIDVGP